jgi:hypothetical protein
MALDGAEPQYYLPHIIRKTVDARPNVAQVLEHEVGCFFSHGKASLADDPWRIKNIRRTLSGGGHVARQPMFVRHAQIVECQHGLALQHEGFAAEAAYDARRQGQ